MSTILKALRRLEDDEASQRAEQGTELRGQLVGASASPEPRRSRVLLWLLAIPAAGLMGALVAALLLPMVFGRDDSPAAATPVAAVEPAASAPSTPTAAASPASSEPAASAPPPARAQSAATAPGATARSVSSPAPWKGATSVSSPAPATVRSVSRSSSNSSAAAAHASSEPSRPVGRPVVERAALPPVASARPLFEETPERVEPARTIEISDDFAVIERNPVPRVLVTQTIWHPRAERRIAVIERVDGAEGGESMRLREGERVGSLQLVAIEPTGVVFLHNGVELRRRVGARP